MKRYVFVGGVDYEFKGVDFRIFCDNRMQRTIRANRARADLTFEIYDFRRGEVATNEVTYSGGQKTENRSSRSPFDPVSKSNYDRVRSGGETHYRFKPGQHGVMSITDVYEAVQDIGANHAGTLQELSVFSHGWMGGPILVNSYDDRSAVVPVPTTSPAASGFITYTVPATNRDPDDKDPRGQLDFIAPTMDATELGNFRDAFASDGYAWLWGCSFPKLVHQVLTKIERNSAYRSRGLGNDVEFTFTNLNDEQAQLLERLLGPLVGPFPNRRRIQVEFEYLKYFLCTMNQSTYSHQLAEQGRVRTYAAPLGTYSEYEKGRLPLMRVHPGFTRHFGFYENYLGFSFDPEGRKYVAYEPGFSCPRPAAPSP